MGIFFFRIFFPRAFPCRRGGLRTSRLIFWKASPHNVGPSETFRPHFGAKVGDRNFRATFWRERGAWIEGRHPPRALWISTPKAGTKTELESVPQREVLNKKTVERGELFTGKKITRDLKRTHPGRETPPLPKIEKKVLAKNPDSNCKTPILGPFSLCGPDMCAQNPPARFPIRYKVLELGKCHAKCTGANARAHIVDHIGAANCFSAPRKSRKIALSNCKPQKSRKIALLGPKKRFSKNSARWAKRL